MSRNVLIVAFVLALGAVAFWLLGGPSKLFGGRTGDDSSAGGGAPGEASGREGADGTGEGADGTGTGPDGRPRGAVLFGRPRAERQGTGALTGRVVRFADQQALADVPVLLSGTDHAGNPVKVETTTDGGGAFVFANAAAGDGLVLRIESRGDAPLVVPDVEVRAGATKELGTIYVGTPGALVGSVVDEAGRAVPNADVRVFTGYGSLMDLIGNFAELFTTFDREPTPLAKGRADPEGKFRVEGIPPGPIVVRAAVPGRRAGVAKTRMTPEGAAGGPVVVTIETGAVVAGVVVDEGGRGVPRASLALMGQGSTDVTAVMFGRVFTQADENGAFRAHVDENETKLLAIVVAEGFPRTISQALAPGREDLRIVLRAGVEVEVTVLEAGSRAPIAGAQVMLMASDSGQMSMGAPDPEADELGGYLAGVTDARGVASFLSRPGVIEMVIATHPGHTMAMASPTLQAMGAAGQVFGGSDGPLEKEIASGRTNRVRLLMAKGVILVGRVKDPQGNGIPGAEVKTMAIGMAFGGGGSTRSGPDGSYRLEGVPAMEGRALAFVKAQGWIAKQSLMEGITVPKDAVGEVTHDFTLTPAATVRGRVVDADGKGVPGAEVTYQSGTGTGFESLLTGRAAAVTGADGAYVLFDLEEGKVPPKEEGKEPAEEPGAGAANPFGGLLGAGGGPRVRARAHGYVGGDSEPFDVSAGGNVTAPTIRLTRGAVVKGRVTEPGGKPIGGATVDAEFPDAGSTFEELFGLGGSSGPKTVRTASDGTFLLGTVPAGETTLTVKSAGWAATRAAVKVDGEASPEPVEVRMRPARDVKGRVLGPDGRGVKGAIVSVDGNSHPPTPDAYVAPATTRTDGDGAFTLKGLPPGRHAVRVTATGFRAGASEAEAGTSVEVRLAVQGADDAKRLQEIQKELTEIYQKIAAATDKGEREALQRRMMELMREQGELQKDSPAMD